MATSRTPAQCPSTSALLRIDGGIDHVLARRFAEAGRELDAALAIARAIDARSVIALACGYAIVARTGLEDYGGARSFEAEGRAAAAGDPSALELIDTYEVYLELCEGVVGSVRRARERVGTLRNGPPERHRRLAAGLLEQLVDRVAPPEGAIVVRHGRIRAPSGRWVDLPPRSPSTRVLDRLVAERLASPGGAIALDELIAAGWPGEQFLLRAATNRLRVVMSSLRSAGLRDAIRTSAGGYFLDPSVLVVVD